MLKIVQENEKNSKKERVANLFEAICWKRIERDVIDMIRQISKNEKDIQDQEQINYILGIFEETDGFIKKESNGKWCVPIGKLNSLDKIETMMYNLLMILNIILPNGLTLSKSKRIIQLIRKFDITGIYLPNITLSNLKLNKVNLEDACLKQAHLEGAYLEWTHLKEAYLKWTYLERAHLEEAHLERAHLERAHLERAHLEWTHLEEAHLEGASLEGAGLEWTHLEGAYLERTNLEEAHLERTNLSKANFYSSILKNAILEDTKISSERRNEIADLGIDVNKIIWCD